MRPLRHRVSPPRRASAQCWGDPWVSYRRLVQGFLAARNVGVLRRERDRRQAAAATSAARSAWARRCFGRSVARRHFLWTKTGVARTARAWTVFVRWYLLGRFVAGRLGRSLRPWECFPGVQTGGKPHTRASSAVIGVASETRAVAAAVQAASRRRCASAADSHSCWPALASRSCRRLSAVSSGVGAARSARRRRRQDRSRFVVRGKASTRRSLTLASSATMRRCGNGIGGGTKAAATATRMIAVRIAERAIVTSPISAEPGQC